MSVPGDRVADIASVLTVLGARVVHGSDDYTDLAPVLPAAMPDWSPVRSYGGYAPAPSIASACRANHLEHRRSPPPRAPVKTAEEPTFWGALGCSCWAF